eukprot:351092-Chlamydomonas_euryale.AAC.1
MMFELIDELGIPVHERTAPALVRTTTKRAHVDAFQDDVLALVTCKRPKRKALLHAFESPTFMQTQAQASEQLLAAQLLPPQPPARSKAESLVDIVLPALSGITEGIVAASKAIERVGEFVAAGHRLPAKLQALQRYASTWLDTFEHVQAAVLYALLASSKQLSNSCVWRLLTSAQRLDFVAEWRNTASDVEANLSALVREAEFEAWFYFGHIL